MQLWQMLIGAQFAQFAELILRIRANFYLTLHHYLKDNSL